MDESDLLIFKNSHKPATPSDIYKKIKKEYGPIIKQKTVYTSIYRLQNLGFINKKRKQNGKYMEIQQANIPVASYLNNLLDEYPHLINKGIFKDTSLEIQLSLLHNNCSAKLISEIINLSPRNTKRYLSKLYKLAIIKRHTKDKSSNEHIWEINKVNNELVKFLETYEEFNALKITQKIDKNASLIWLKGMEFLIKTQKNIQQSKFQKTGAGVLGKYGLKLLPGDTFFYYSNRNLNIWDHAFLTLLSRKHDPTQLRYLAYLYHMKQPDKDEFKQKGEYYIKEAAKKVIDLFEHGQETTELKMKHIKELEQLYGRQK
jgi:Fe2+ or Zn2+ uptake regulation protein